MRIDEMTEGDCWTLLAHERIGRLACAHDNQPYIVPIYYAQEGSCLYSFTSPGLKIEWMRVNPLVCVEVDRINATDDWVSVLAFGRFEQLVASAETDQWHQEQRRAHPPVTPEGDATILPSEYQRAHDLLESHHPDWFEPVVASSMRRNPKSSLSPLYYKIHVDRVTGRRARPSQIGTIR